MKKKYTLSFLFLALFLFAQNGFSQTELSKNEYGTLIQNWLEKNKGDYNLTQNDISDLQVSNAFFSKKTKINHVYVNQAFQGIPVFNAISSVSIKDKSVFYYANAFQSNIAAKINTMTPTVSAQEAIVSAAAEYNLGALGNVNAINASNNQYTFSKGDISGSDIPVKLVYQTTIEGDLKLAWDLSIEALNGQNWYSVRVDATNGDILNMNDWVISCNFGEFGHTDHTGHSKTSNAFSLFKTEASIAADGSQYNVFALPTESPSHGAIQLITDPADLDASPYGWHDTDGVDGSEYTITRGNNVWAQEDVNGNNAFGASPDGGLALDFNFPFNPNQEPLGYQDVSTTNLFYINNAMHDIWFKYGFDEGSGNFQQNNYSNTGFDNDLVIAQSQDGSGLNNANFATPADGQSPRMQMYLWAAGTLSTPLTINSGGTLIGDVLAAIPSTGNSGGATGNITGPSATPVTADLALVNDGSAAPTEGCAPLTNASAVAGKIAVIFRGDCPFTQKIQNAQDAGAVGVIMVNHNNPDNEPNYQEYIVMFGSTNPPFTIPSISVNYNDGIQLINALQNGAVINGTIVESPNYQKDGSLDNSIVAHEYGHGISTRLTGGSFNSGCLSNSEQMGEGWSDWFALMVTMKSTDTPEMGRGIATYSNSQGVNGPGIRPAKYSTDLGINNYTYEATNDDTVLGTDGNGNQVHWNDVVHNIGFLWGTMLWDLTWKYVEKYGFDPDMYNGTGGNNKVMQLVIDGLKLQPCGVGFVQGRDALLAADSAMGGEDQCLIWDVFAARGLGVNASQGSADSINDQISDFTTPPDTDPTLVNCTTLSVDGFTAESAFSIYPNPADNVVYIKTKKNLGDVTINLIDINGRVVLSKKAALINEAELNISTLQSGMYILNITGNNVNINNKIIKN
ncbi:T9SS type A sorting domain-containing protein [Bizionia gelidisalsuginis]|uniref:T9SS type A sorting domain-containing protein n=2 Tax=Bizionia TaxID=283785 RepID=A0A8H2QJP6_9FLAO|nr:MULTISPECIES: T9SS-dependent M36 family metallopeptidase [Bizionia]TYB76093.1 T9SS type A sorting domain-containing protein [Bizionia saleffrena]TYC11385.1 T9SS type A sorting domain-containing protein [Bizionia gelidisalsuginis]